MGAEIRVAGFTLTVDEWERFEPDVRAELFPAAEVTRGDGDDGQLDGDADVLW